MAKNSFMVMDSDLHVLEPPDLWLRYIEPTFLDRAPKGIKSRYPRNMTTEVEGRLIPIPVEQESPRYHEFRSKMDELKEEDYRYPIERGFDAVSQLHAMDREGVDVAMLFPSRGLMALGMDGLDPELAAAIASAYNNWLYDFCQTDPKRMYGAAMIAPQDIELAIKEARRAVEQLGFRGIFIRPNPINGRNWHDPHYDPLWAEIQQLGVPLEFHEGGRVHLPQVGIQFETNTLYHVCSQPMQAMLAMVSIIGGGVLERFPKLIVAFLEGNCSWVPWCLWRLEEHMEPGSFGGWIEHPDLTMKATEYFKRQCYVSVECDEEFAKQVVEWLGDDKIVFSTDYPHLDSKYPHAVERFLELPLTDETKGKLLWDNCARLYGLEQVADRAESTSSIHLP